MRLLARYLEVPSAPQREFILLDFDYYYEGELKTGKILDYLRKSHTHTKKIFEDIISDEYKMVMEIDRTASKSLICLTFFTSYDYKLRKPLPIVIERGMNPNTLLIGNEELNKYGVGSSKEEALKEFEDFIIADYRTLRDSSPEELTEDAKELLTLHDSYIEL